MASGGDHCAMRKRPRLDVPDDTSAENLEEELRQFQVLDEVNEDDSDSANGKRMNSSYSAAASSNCWPIDERSDNDDSETDLDENEIENMLDAGLPDDLKGKRRSTAQYQEKSKTVLEGTVIIWIRI